MLDGSGGGPRPAKAPPGRCYRRPTPPRPGLDGSMSPPLEETFSGDCGIRTPLALDVTAPGQDRQRQLFAPPCVLVGRHPAATLRLDDPAVSRRHAYLQVLGGRVYA